MSFLATPTEKEMLKAELTTIINNTVTAGIVDCQALAQKWQKDLVDGTSLQPLEMAMQIKARSILQTFDRKIDNLTGRFWKQTQASRRLTHQMAHDDLVRQQQQQQQQQEKERERKEKKLQQQPKPTAASWSKTNNAWDQEWDDW